MNPTVKFVWHAGKSIVSMFFRGVSVVTVIVLLGGGTMWLLSPLPMAWRISVGFFVACTTVGFILVDSHGGC